MNKLSRIIFVGGMALGLASCLSACGPKGEAANLKARIRMSILYAYGQNHNYLVLGTDNKDERYTGYFTKYGDGAADIYPVAKLVKGEVVQALRGMSMMALGAEANKYFIPVKSIVGIKPTWSEEDEKIISDAEVWLDTLCDYLKDSSSAYISNVRVIISKLKSLKDRVQPHPQWSEEDETVLNNLIYALANDRIGNNRDEYVDWLKSFHPQPKQEWSEEDERNKRNLKSVLFYDKHLPKDTYFQLNDWLKSLKERMKGE